MTKATKFWQKTRLSIRRASDTCLVAEPDSLERQALITIKLTSRKGEDMNLDPSYYYKLIETESDPKKLKEELLELLKITVYLFFRTKTSEMETAMGGQVERGVMCAVTNGGRKLSRQYHDQQENLKNGECIFCRKPLLTKRHCKECAEKVRTMARNRYRKKAGIKLDAPLYGPRRKIST